VQLLREASNEVVQEWGQKLDEMPVRLIEEPKYRLAGAEEAVRQLVATIEQALQHHEPLLKDLTTRAREAYARLRILSQPLSQTPNRRRPPPAADVLELMRNYAKWRYQSLVLGQFMSGFLTLRGHLADEMREIGFCRVRLTELQRLLAEPNEPDADKPRDGGRHLFPPGCQGLEDAVKVFLADVGPEAVQELDVQIQAMLRKRFTALVQVCVSRANMLKDVQAALVETAETFAAGLRNAQNVAEMFLEQHPDPQVAEDEVAGFLDEAAPEPLGPRQPPGTVPEVCVVAAPPGPAGDRIRELARKAAPGSEVHTAAPSLNSDDEIVVYRELSNVSLADLEQLGPIGQEAYDRMTSAENFTPHSRTDVRFLSQATR
jgi:hypothetical protein